MKRQVKSATLSAILLFILFSCADRDNLIGSWQNEQRTLIFNADSTFSITFNDSSEIKAMRGVYFVKGATILLAFEEFQGKENNWTSTNNTDLYGYIESIQFSILADTLVTKIMASNAIYEYKKQENSPKR